MLSNKRKWDTLLETISLRLFKTTDIEFAYKSTIIEEWNCSRKDMQRMFNYNPLGCFMAEVNGKQAGHVFSVGYGKLGWIGFLIIRAEHRKKGIGTLLMNMALNHLLNCEVETIKLEAVPEIAELYRKLGFVDEYDSLRLSGSSLKIASTTSSNIKLLKREMIKEVAKFDVEYFGANRIKVLTSLFEDYPKLCLVSYAGSAIAGYIMCREAEEGYRIGPWVCNPEKPQVGRQLLTRCVQTLGQNTKLYVGVPAVNETAVEIMQEFGFEQYSKSIRMRFGKELKNERIDGIFAIGGPEKG